MGSYVSIAAPDRTQAHEACRRLWYVDAAINDYVDRPDGRVTVTVELPDREACRAELERAVLRARLAGVDVDAVVDAAQIEGSGDAV